ncbi:MAG: 2-dehydropantoate 2-reductase N-terminal domain-containing protein, partial [Elusimicrobiota bacterium]
TADDVREVEVVLLATKTYDNDTAIPLVKRLIEQGSQDAFVLSLQNGVSSPYALAEAVGEARVLAGPTYVATALVEPGRIVQTGAHRRIAFGEVFNIGAEVSPRAMALHEVFVGADIISEPHADGRVPLWTKYTYLAPFAAYSVGKCKEAEGDLAGAQVQYSDFLLKNPEHFIAPEVHASLARSQELSGNAELAKTTYEKIALLYPDTSWATQARTKSAPPASAPVKK